MNRTLYSALRLILLPRSSLVNMAIILYDIASRVPGSAWNVNTWKARYVLTLSPNDRCHSNLRIDSA